MLIMNFHKGKPPALAMYLVVYEEGSCVGQYINGRYPIILLHKKLEFGFNIEFDI